MRIIQARRQHLPLILDLCDQARGIMRASGNHDQWTNGYPDEATLLRDIEHACGYLCLDATNAPVAYFAMILGEEPTYAHIDAGQWIDAEKPYAVIHRIASTPASRGVLHAIVGHAFSVTDNVRIDTHRDNGIMRHLLDKMGFTYCGVIHLANGDERLAYQKMQPNVTIQVATSEQAPHIARLIMMAMSDDCCRYFCGSRHTLDDFYAMMTRLVLCDDSQYSYRNTLVALDGNQVVGAAVAYDGAELHTLRRAFVAMAHEYLDMDFSHMGDETQPGELYLDSLAVLPEYRHRGIAARLLEATKERARVMRLPAVGLLVDQDNPGARSLYEAAGFHYVNDNTWGGHLMHHLVCKIHSNSDL